MSSSGGIFDYDGKKEQLVALESTLSDPNLWEDQEKARTLVRKRSGLSRVVEQLDQVQTRLLDLQELAEISADDSVLQDELQHEASHLEKAIGSLEFQRMFSGQMDNVDAFLEIRPRAGGTEAQDWAEMLLRMYVRFGETQQFDTQILDVTYGDVAGIRGAVVRFAGDHAYGWLRTESGIHRLVRNSPFNAENKRHTSFASVSVSPQVDNDIVVDLDMSDVRVDTYRASGAGGQHVNKTDSAVRLTHLPTGVVVQCQNDRSQHKNKEWAIKLLRSKLYELAEQKRREEEQKLLKSEKSITSWGDQIRSYVLDQSRVKDHRTNVENSNPNAVLDGDLSEFIEVSLKSGL